jgi:tRNA-specific 2-thiouridylase
MNKTVVVAMSGGVDSSVAALLLKQQGYHVVGMYMKNWEEKDAQGRCLSAAEFEDVQRVCSQRDIPCYAVNFVQEYRDHVFARFLYELEQGRTPNPDILCNREIKFKVLLEKAIEIGGDYLATGHYCRIEQTPAHSSLLKGTDPGKDQSYFLYAVEQKALRYVLFPVGGMLKAEVRQLARRFSLATAEKKDSTGICFIGKRNFKEFLSRHASFTPGVFKTLEGEVVGTHEGVGYYTIGQRKGMGIGGRGDAWFVVSKEVETGTVFVAQGAEHPALFTGGLTAEEVHWIKGVPPTFPLKCHAKVRYRQSDQECTVNECGTDSLEVRFAVPQRAVTTGQSIVFYQGDECLGGGVIVHA